MKKPRAASLGHSQLRFFTAASWRPAGGGESAGCRRHLVLRVFFSVSLLFFLPGEISTSQTDVREGLLSVHGGRRGSDLLSSIQKSLSDTDISKSSKVEQKLSVPIESTSICTF